MNTFPQTPRGRTVARREYQFRGTPRPPVAAGATSTPLPPLVENVLEEMITPGRDDQGPKKRVLANTRLTSLVGLVIFVELFLIGITVPAISQLLAYHVILGFALIPPLLIKLTSTSYRFVRYYTRNPRYYAAGPPQMLLRVAAPLLIISTIALFGSGVELMLKGPTAFSTQTWRGIHQASFVIWFALAAIHIVSYLPKAVYQGGRDLGLRSLGMIRFSAARVSGSGGRILVAIAVVLFGVLLAAWGYHTIAPWQHFFSQFRTGGR
ncbi:MAG: hypothetical protein M0Z47_12085 [Actinomycetota bacterium]|nr:hypothetical protein [Actinomycetota bacterium]